MFRLKITQLTILYSNKKITYIVSDNVKHHTLHPHILKCLQNLVMEGLLYLMKINEVISGKIGLVEESVVKELLDILLADRERLVTEFKRESEKFKHTLDYEKELLAIKSYNIRRYENELYNFLTEYCDYPNDIKDKLSVIVSILVDVYDSSLKLT